MTSNEIMQADMLDILFDNRNKQYGAYTLRKFYKNRLLLSLGLALSSTFLLFLFIGAGHQRSASTVSKDAVVLKDYVVPEKEKLKIEKPKMVVASKAAAAPTRRFTDRIEIVRNDKLIKDPMIRMNDLQDVIISDISREGIPGGSKIPERINAGGDGIGKNDVVKPSENFIQREPEFPGGLAAWLAFLNRHLRSPDDLEAGEKKMVVIRFDVAGDGSVTNFQIVQSAGGQYDNEVIRVLKKMPKWKPAVQNNEPVARSFTQPVTFMGIED